MGDQLKRDWDMYKDGPAPSYEEYKAMRAKQLPLPGQSPLPAPQPGMAESIWKAITANPVEVNRPANPAELPLPGKMPLPELDPRAVDSLRKAFKYKP